MRTSWLLISLLVCLPQAALQAQDSKRSFDVAIYGATPAGVAAAITVARRQPNESIALLTPYSRIGGMITNGLTHPDFRTFEGRTGLFRELNRRVEAYYRDRYGVDSQQVKDSLHGTHAGPEVNYRVLQQMLVEHPNIEVFTGYRITDASVTQSKITYVSFDGHDQALTITARYLVDGTYEGDLLAAAGVPYRVGRESREEYGEPLAPESADDQLQGFNFRLTMTDVTANQAPIPKPEGYQRNDYLGLLPLLVDGSIQRVFGDPFADLPGGIYKRQTPRLPNGKRDINDVSRSIVRLSLPGANRGWPDGDAAARQAIFDQHLRHNVGMLYFLQNDGAVPDHFRQEANAWGLCRDEFTFNRHLPEQLYVREARRMVGRYIFTQGDTEASAEGRVRARFQPDAIAMGDYGPNCHGTEHEGPLFGGKHTGEFYQRAAPYQIPYGTLLPDNVENLAVPVACSSSHVGFCALRLEPIWMSLGQAAGEAIALGLDTDGQPLKEIEPQAIRRGLHQAGVATIYTSDVPEESADFAPVQWWGALGGLDVLDAHTANGTIEYGTRGPQRVGQYYQPFPGHAVELDKPLDAELADAWTQLASRSILTPSALATLKRAGTRGKFIRAAYSVASAP